MISDHHPDADKGAAEDKSRREVEAPLSPLTDAIQSLAAAYHTNQKQQRAHDHRVVLWQEGSAGRGAGGPNA
jgi:hypothetical protein